ncbi:MAG: phosphatidylserine/phosphatidylglycerophosphate/cardiolipin synthase family protein [Bacteroidota bacterium]
MQSDYELFSDPITFYNAMLSDIVLAKKHIYIETYKFANDAIGIKFRNALIRKCKEGVVVKILADSWGSTSNEEFFSEFTAIGGEVRFFEKVIFSFDFFTRNHRRDHRKIILIDDSITYIGSANIAAHSLNWRESVLRIENDITLKFNKIFFDYFKTYQKPFLNKFTYKKNIRYKQMQIIRDMPSIYRQLIKRQYEKLIRKAQTEIIIETPYLIPGFKLRKALIDASNRGVKVSIIIPRRSDVRLADFLRDKYLGIYYKNQINILFYVPQNLHAKLLLFDHKTFALGSPNFDYRSFRYMHEIIITGQDSDVVNLIEKHVNETLVDCEPFDFDRWTQRPFIERIFGWLLIPFRHLL